MDLEVECRGSPDGWFEVRGWLSGNAGQFSGLEAEISQGVCGGSVGGSAPHASNNHMARCGFVNVFHYDRNDCEIYDISDFL